MEISAELRHKNRILTEFDKIKLSLEELELITRRACVIIENSAKDKITQKGHIVTGALRRSIRTVVKKMMSDVIEHSVGSELSYAYYVEVLPDGGYLWESILEKGGEVLNYIRSEFKKRGIS